MKLIRISIFAAVYANEFIDSEEIDVEHLLSGEELPENDYYESEYIDVDDEPLLPGEEEVEADKCWMYVNAPEDVKRAHGCEEPGMRSFIARGRFIMEDYLCRADDAADWCVEPFGKGKNKVNRDEFNNLLNYGCNCWPDNKKAPGYPTTGHWQDHLWSVPGTNGRPLDDVDAACQQMSARYRCVKHELGDCDYTIDYKYVWDQNKGKVKCNRGSDCQRRICTIDKMFALELKVLLNGKRPSQYVNENPDFQRAFEKPGVCVSNAAPIGDLQCCGRFWERFPYDADSQKCCDNQIFDQNSADATC